MFGRREKVSKRATNVTKMIFLEMKHQTYNTISNESSEQEQEKSTPLREIFGEGIIGLWFLPTHPKFNQVELITGYVLPNEN